MTTDYQHCNEILPKVWVGDLAACPDFWGLSICVHEQDICHEIHCRQMPILVDGVAHMAELERVAGAIEWSKGPILIHCAAGQERSPLAVAYFLVTRNHMTWDDAYKLLMTKRPVVQDRRAWLEPALRNG